MYAKCEGGRVTLGGHGIALTLSREDALSLRNDLNRALTEQMEHRMSIMDAETADNKAKAKRAKGEA